ncbi:MAG: hypothetical protein AAB433_02560 [Nitrospirota bacterium]|jgi:uncharacterized protein YeaO (DUF488 family)
MTILKRAQIRPGVQGIDTTVKSAQGLWRAFAPRWDMVIGSKHGTLSWRDYCTQYAQILARVPMHVWDELARAEEQTMLCYCRDGWNCHTHEIIAYAVRQFPDRFRDGHPAPVITPRLF